VKVLLAGFNVDAALLPTDDARLTPEVLSAAYARISRSARSIDTLRVQARSEVVKSRRSNESIVFEMGHSSVAEHAVFNFDLIGVSRLMAEWIQRSRLASFTEKSQRYVKLNGDWVCPPEITGTPLQDELGALVERQNDLYRTSSERAAALLKQTACIRSDRDKDGRAREDARYALSLATCTQMGMTLNARSLQRLLRRLDRCPLDEAKELHSLLREAATSVAPSLVRYTHTDDFERGCAQVSLSPIPAEYTPGVRLLRADEDIDATVLAGLLYEQGAGDWAAVAAHARGLPPEQLAAAYEQLFRHLRPWHTMPRAFESAMFSFELTLSSCAFAQLKRHRMATLLTGARGDEILVPPLLRRLGMDDAWQALARDCATTAHRLDAVKPGLGDYARTNAHLLRAMFQANLRELYHFARLRADSHAQWEIRRLAADMDALVRAHAPLAARRLMGKHELESARA